MWFVSCLSSVLVLLFRLYSYSFRSQFSVVGGILFTLRQASPSSRVLQHFLLHARSPTMMFDHLLHQCCWPTCMDSLLRCALALRSHSSIGFHSCPCLSLCSHCLPCPCRRGNRVCCPWSPFCLLSWLRHLSCHSSVHQLHIFHPDANTRKRLVKSRTHLHNPSQKRWLPGVRGIRKPPRRARRGAPTCSHPHG